MKRWDLHIPIYDKVVVLIQTDTIKNLDEYIGTIYSSPVSPTSTANLLSAATYADTPDDFIYLGVLDNCSLKEIVHECGHVAWKIMEIVGCQDEEAFCYLLDYIFDKVHKQLFSECTQSIPTEATSPQQDKEVMPQ